MQTYKEKGNSLRKHPMNKDAETGIFKDMRECNYTSLVGV